MNISNINNIIILLIIYMEKIENNEKIPKNKRIKTEDIKGTLDEDGFFTTPNGSFWDCDGEYFNRFGFDIHGGSYVNKLDYIPGPDWLDEYGCYPEDIEKYKNIEDDLDDNEDFDENLFKENFIPNKKKKSLKKKKKSKKKKEEEEDEEWEEINDSEDENN